jgi:hypothetical protein
MPIGNESLVIAIRDDLQNQPFTIENLFGNINLKASVPDYGNGILSNLVVTNQNTKFERVPMMDFAYLFNEIPVPLKWRVSAGLFAALLSLPVWTIMVFVGKNPQEMNRFKNY